MDWKTHMNDTSGQLRRLNKAIPDTIADRCTDCIGFHVQALAKAGGTREEMADVVAMAIQMGGGPSLMYGAKAIDAWDQLVGES
ncbi:MAG: alkylhydroperoxidase [Rhodobacterales bacterium]|nr:MAG: alkylhydroperoxidase [Rhodobacterales bacterium]